ncbi:MAG: chorismate mutase [Patescibacteria group bacterium]|nr:chorismate mutase [Patescibacteria group bacterium]
MKELKDLRKEIDKLDRELLKILKKRLGLSRKIWEKKKDLNLKRIDPQRELEIVKKVVEKGVKHGLKQKFVKDLFLVILNHSKKH